MTHQYDVLAGQKGAGLSRNVRARILRVNTDSPSCGRPSLKDEVREGRPKTAVVSENIDAVREVTMQDCHVTYRAIEASLSISSYFSDSLP